MKARLPSNKRMSRVQLQACDEYINQRAEQQNEITTRKIFKLFCYCLNKDFGLGKDKLTRLIDSVDELLDVSRDDEVFWEHVDKFLIEQKHIPFDREKYEDVLKEREKNG